MKTKNKVKTHSFDNDFQAQSWCVLDLTLTSVLFWFCHILNTMCTNCAYSACNLSFWVSCRIVGVQRPLGYCHVRTLHVRRAHSSSSCLTAAVLSSSSGFDNETGLLRPALSAHTVNDILILQGSGLALWMQLSFLEVDLFPWINRFYAGSINKQFLHFHSGVVRSHSAF